MDYNRQYFSKKDIKAGLYLKFIQFLVENFESDEYRVDIHIYHEENGAIIVEWIRQLWDAIADMGQFVFVAGDEYIEKERN